MSLEQCYCHWPHRARHQVSFEFSYFLNSPISLGFHHWVSSLSPCIPLPYSPQKAMTCMNSYSSVVVTSFPLHFPSRNFALTNSRNTVSFQVNFWSWTKPRIFCYNVYNIHWSFEMYPQTVWKLIQARSFQSLIFDAKSWQPLNTKHPCWVHQTLEEGISC